MDPASFRLFYHESLPIVFRYLRLRSGSDAFDLVQDTYLTAVRSLQRGAMPDDPLAWIMTIARRRLVDYYRSVARRESQHVALRPSLPRDIDEPLMSEAVVIALNRLPARQRIAVVLRYMDDMSVGDVARELDLSYQATESLLARARRRLAIELGEEGPT